MEVSPNIRARTRYAILSVALALLLGPSDLHASTVFSFTQPVITNTPSIVPPITDGLMLTVTAENGGGNPANVNQSTNGEDGIGVQGGGSARIGSDEIAIFTFATPVLLQSLEFNAAINSPNPLFNLFLDGVQITGATVGGNPQTSPFSLTPNAVSSWTPSILSPTQPADGISEIRVQALDSGTGFRISGLTVSAVPEPGRTFLLGASLIAVAYQRRRPRSFPSQ